MLPTEEDSPDTTQQAGQRPSRWLAFALVGLVLLLAGGAAGWSIRGGDESSTPAYVVPGGAALTERQQEMVTLFDDYIAAWQMTDGDGVASFMTADGYIEYKEEGWIFRASDGTLQARVTHGPYSTLRSHVPIVVYDDRIVVAGRLDTMNLNWLSVIQFTTNGGVKIISETIFL